MKFQILDRYVFDVALAAVGLTQTALAHRVGVAQCDVSRVRAGFVPRPALQEKIAAALGVDVRALFPTIDHASITKIAA